jgi:GT2 family glycosyltransferase
MNTFTLVIPTINNKDIKRTLKSVFSNTILPNQIIIIDQNKNNSSACKIKKIFNDRKYDNFKFLKIYSNPSLTKAKNLSIKHVKSKKIIFLDDDMIIDKFFFFIAMRLSFKIYRIISGIVVNQNIKITYFYNIFFHNIFKDNRQFFFSKKKINYPRLYVAGGITLYDKIIFNRIRFDEKYLIHNYEDVDFCLRVKSLFPKIEFIISQNMKTYELNKSSGREDYIRRFYYLNILYLKNKKRTTPTSFFLATLGLYFKYLLRGRVFSIFSALKFYFKINLKMKYQA